jgi:hypothetical protein
MLEERARLLISYDQTIQLRHRKIGQDAANACLIAGDMDAYRLYVVAPDGFGRLLINGLLVGTEYWVEDAIRVGMQVPGAIQEQYNVSRMGE